MIILKINNNEGQFLSGDGNFKNITQISKEEIYYLLNLAFDEETIDMDQINEENEIKNPANKIIYENIYEKLKLFIVDKSRIRDEITTVFSEFKVKYEEELKD